MNPFAEFRSWLKTGPSQERLLAAIAVVVVLALAVWASVPGSSGPATLAASTSGSTTAGVIPTFAPAAGTDNNTATTQGSDAVTGGSAPTSTGSDPGDSGSGTTGTSTQAGTTTVASGSGSGSASGSQSTPTTPGVQGATSTKSQAPTTTKNKTKTTTAKTKQVTTTKASAAPTASAAAANCPKGATDNGVTDTTITIGVLIYTTGSANSLIGIPASTDWEKAYDAEFQRVNAAGGVFCRKLVPKYYVDNVLDTNGEHSVCLQVVADKDFAVLNNPYNQSERDCLISQGVPDFFALAPSTAELKQYAPYVFSNYPDLSRLMHLYIRGASDLGFFKGATKLGIVEYDCFPDENAALGPELSAIGFDISKASIFDYGCPSATQAGAGDPATDTQAALQMKNAGVTNILSTAQGSISNFSRAADQQNYTPKYAIPDDGTATIIGSSTSKPGNSFNNALVITTYQTGAESTPGYVFNAQTTQCTQDLAAVGLPAPQSSGVASYYGGSCAEVAEVSQAILHAPVLQRNAITTGLSRAGSFDVSFPYGPVDVTNPAEPTGGSVFRPDVYLTSCTCFRVSDTNFRAPSQ